MYTQRKSLANVSFKNDSTLQSDCLADEPVRVSSLRFPDKLPGQIFDADTQCKWQFGQHARLCIFEFGKVFNGVWNR